MNQVLDDRRPLSSCDDLRVHLHECGDCRELARSYEALLSGLGYQVVPAPPAGLTARVMDDFRLSVRPPTPRPLLRFPQSAAALSLAATVLLVAIGLAWLNAPKRGEVNRPITAEQTSIAQAQGASHHRRQIERATAVTTESATSAANVAQETRPEEADAAAYIGAFPPADWGPAGAEWAHDVADGLEPVTQPTMGAISGFLNLWGIGQQGHRS